jgi:hypothetical protein
MICCDCGMEYPPEDMIGPECRYCNTENRITEELDETCINCTERLNGGDNG